MLSWYDEAPGQLAETVASLGKFADHVIAADGAYVAFPGALSQPISAPEESEVILRAAAGVGIGCTLHIHGPWLGNEVEKRGAMLDLLDSMADPGDWFLVIDGDEVLSHAPANPKKYLDGLDRNSADILRWKRYVPEERVGSTTTGQEPMRRLYKFVPPMRLAGTHFAYESEGRAIWREPGAVAYDIRLEHRPRPAVRMRQKAEYRNRVTVLETPEDGG